MTAENAPLSNVRSTLLLYGCLRHSAILSGKQVGRELGARYVLEGSVRKATNRVRITAQLIDATTGAHLWADRFESTLDDVFELQDQVSESVVGAISPQLERAEMERAKRKPTGSMDAYDCYLRGMASFHRSTKEATNEALQWFTKAIQLDPDFAPAYAMAAWCYFWRKINGWMTNRPAEIAEGTRLAGRAVALARMMLSFSQEAAMRSRISQVTSIAALRSSTRRWPSIRTSQQPGSSAAS